MAGPSCTIENNEAKIRAAFGRLRVQPQTAEKTIRLMKFVNDSGISIHDARRALKMLRASGSDGVGGALLPAALLSGAGAALDFRYSKVAAMGTNEIATSLNMAKAMEVGVSPGRATAMVVLMVAQKGLAAAGIADQNDANRCREAVAKLTVDVGVTALTWETGIGAYLGVAGAVLDVADAWNTCRP